MCNIEWLDVRHGVMQVIERIDEIRSKQVENALPLLFTGWQVSIVRKLLNGELLTESERQEFSRHIRRKLRAILILQVLDVLVLPRSPGKLDHI